MPAKRSDMREPVIRKSWPVLRGILSLIVAACLTVFPAEISGAAASDLHLKIKELVRRLDYPEAVAEDFLKMVCRWKEQDGKESLLTWHD
jgi:hypothetical protein